MPSLMNSKNILAALNNIEGELPSLVGPDAWAKISDAFSKKLDQLRCSNEELEQQQLSAHLIGLLVPYHDARERLKMAILAEAKQEDLYSSIMADLASLAGQMGLQGVRAKLDAEVLQSSSEQIRVVFMKKDFDNVKSIKLKNLNFDFGEMSALAGGILTTSSKILGDTHPILVAAGVLLIVRSLYKAVTVKIEEREASVFWGFIQACDKEKTASEAAIIKYTNKERERAGLEQLTTNQVKNALHKLASLRSITAVGDKPATWRIIEKYKIKH
jgi:hypothetical protein